MRAERRTTNGVCHSTQRPYESKDQSCAEPYQAAACVFQHGGSRGRSPVLSPKRQRPADSSDLSHSSCHAPVFPVRHVRKARTAP